MDFEGEPVSPGSCIPAGVARDGASLGGGTCSGIPQPSIQKTQQSLQERFQQCKSENALLGQLLQDCQAECTRLKSQLKQEKSKASRQQEANKARVAQLQKEVQQSQEAASELKRVKSTASTHAASLRRQEERQRQLEDIIVDLKHELDASKASEQSALDTASAMKKDIARKELRYRQAAAAANRARDELANEKENRNNAVAVGHADLQATLKQVQNQAEEATSALKQAHDAQIRELRARVEQLKAERDTLQEKNSELMERKSFVPAEQQQSSASAQPAGALLGPSSSNLEAMVTELQARNHRLQKALARKVTSHASDRQMVLNEGGPHITSQGAQQARLAETVQTDDTSRQDLVHVTERLTAVVQLNSELLVDNSNLTQQLQAAEQKLSDARRRLATAEHLQDTCQTHRSSPEAWQRSSASCCSFKDMVQDPCYPDVRETANRVLQQDHQQLMATVESLKKGMRECVLEEHDARQMLQEARRSELLATQRLADCNGRVHTLELMRLHDLREMNRLRSCGAPQTSRKMACASKLIPGVKLPASERSSMPSMHFKHAQGLQSVFGSGSMEHTDMPLSLQALASL